eukprot:CAMPEP_0180420454 /NCGR_PEP_ID=MMETSP1036_2-20121128/2641_2 /TAXON_ID=632150 /ORGANISM="Azadinium spinosum, Strain 3D9" /LENGTH=102 /DNA_ID=CAMNT_0022425683 /DNA_START=997 /DNA_END=1305 /DNA_ORIENTATION=-
MKLAVSIGHSQNHILHGKAQSFKLRIQELLRCPLGVSGLPWDLACQSWRMKGRDDVAEALCELQLKLAGLSGGFRLARFHGKNNADLSMSYGRVGNRLQRCA